jgi:glycosyltransferase involved in cell wall biosynthesis
MKTDNRRSPQKLLIVETNPTGHRLYYVKLIADAGLDAGMQVFLATSPDARQTAEYKLHLANMDDQIELIDLALASPQSVESIAIDISADRTIVPDGDRFGLALARCLRWRGGRLSVLIMREVGQPSPYAGVSMLKTVIKRFLLFRSRLFPDVEIFYLKSATWAATGSRRIVRDPVTIAATPVSISSARAQLDGRKASYWFGVLGAISERKNVPLVARALSELSGDVGLLIAGKLSPSSSAEILASAATLRASGKQVLVVDDFLSDEELDSYIAALDCIVLAHSNEGPSGLLGKATSVGTRLVLAGARSLRNDSEAIPLVAEWVPLTRGDLTAAFQRATASAAPNAIRLGTSNDFGRALLGFPIIEGSK